MKRVIAIIILSAILMAVFGCARTSDNTPTDSPAATPQINTEEPAATPSPERELASTEIIELERLDVPNIVEGGGSFEFLDIEELFSLCGYAVYCKIVSTQEVKIVSTYTTGSPSEINATVLEVEVVKNYGNKDLEHIKDGKIRIEYPTSTHKRYICSVDFKAGDECILLLMDSTAVRPNMPQNYYEYVPYRVFATGEFVIEKTENGFNALGLMALSKGETYAYIEYLELDERGAAYYSLEEVEAVISDNIDKLQGLTYKEFLQNYLIRRQNAE